MQYPCEDPARNDYTAPVVKKIDYIIVYMMWLHNKKINKI